MAASTALQVLVSPLLGTIFGTVSSLIQSEFALIWGVNNELEKLSITLSTVQDVLEDAETRQIANKPIRNWLRKLKDVAYEAEDVLDECRTEALKPESELIETNNSCNNIQVLTDSVSSCFLFKRILFRRTIAKRINNIIEKFDVIANERLKFHLNINLTTRDVEMGALQHRETSSFLDESKVYGRDEDKEYIVNLLLNNIGVEDDAHQHKEGDVSVCAILGMGGLGKTTLAQMVHNDERIVKHFEVRSWVFVSENFELKTLLRAIIESLGGYAHDIESLDPLQRRLQERLSGKRFLVVLDDVWNNDQSKWDKLNSLLRCGDRGSSVIITTRLETVASIMARLAICRPKVLSEEDCWSLFKSRAFVVDNNEEIHPNLNAIGKEIVKKCGGVPLAAKALGGLLRTKREENEWLFVRDSEIWDLPQDTEESILHVLRLSYNHLPAHVKQCFAFCSIFPKGRDLDKKELIHVWVANGFIQPKEHMELEDIGNEIFNDLLWRSFFQIAATDGMSNVLACSMHDLVHDLACSIMGNECLSLEVGKADTVQRRSTSTRHLSLVFRYSSSSSSTINLEESLLKCQPHLRTLLFQNLTIKKIHTQLNFSYLKCLRILDLSRTGIKSVPVSIGNLKHLRYLNLSCTKIISLPNESFSKLRHLQILNLKSCFRLQSLPEDLRKMSSLRHLDFSFCPAVTRMPIRMGKLINLRTLNAFFVGSENGCGIEELQGLNHLGGELEITGMEHVRNSTNARNADLMEKKNLRSLKLYWAEVSGMLQNDGTSQEEEERLVMVGEGLQPHPNMKELVIEGYPAEKFPSWMAGFSCLPNLVEISLVKCKKCEWLPPLGGLPLLKVLKIHGMNSVQCISNEFYHGDHHHQQRPFFPSLEEFEISYMPNLEDWSLLSPNEENTRGGSDVHVLAFPCLETLTVESCPKLRRCPPLQSSLQTLKLLGCSQMILIRLLESLPPCLHTLWIGQIDDLISSPLEDMMMKNLRNLTSLNFLYISSCSELKTLPIMEGLTALGWLEISKCDQLEYFPGLQNLNSLKSFRITSCQGVKSLYEGLRHLTTLKYLEIADCPQLEFSPDDFLDLINLIDLSLVKLPKMTLLPVVGSQHLEAALRILRINGCSALKTLPQWIANFTSLHGLDILNCENLKVLPEGLQLTHLHCLMIEKCHPDLHRQCEKEVGDAFHKFVYYINNP